MYPNKIYYGNVECPHCGNEFTVNSGTEVQTCGWCRRPVSVSFKLTSKKKKKFTVEPADFSAEQRKGFNKWKEEKFYGKHS